MTVHLTVMAGGCNRKWLINATRCSSHGKYWLYARVLCAAFSTLIPLSSIGNAQTIGQCDPSTISFVDAGAQPLVLTPSRNSTIAIHVQARNDSSVTLDHWCTGITLTDYEQTTLAAKLTTASIGTGDCKELSGVAQTVVSADVEVPPGHIQALDFVVRTDVDRLPATGWIELAASGIANHVAQFGAPEQQHARGRADDGTLIQCRTFAKQISRSIVVSTLSPSLYAQLVPIISLIASAVFLLVCGLCFRKTINLPMGGPQWNFSTSFATNFTVLGGILGSALASSALPEFPRLMTKSSYIVLTLMFALITGVAPILYNVSCQRGPSGLQGRVWLFLGSASITIWAVFGQLLTLALLIADFVSRGNLAVFSGVCIDVLLALMAVGLVRYSFLTAALNVQQSVARSIATQPDHERDSESQGAQGAPTWQVL
jgi:hypothetical protein